MTSPPVARLRARLAAVDWRAAAPLLVPLLLHVILKLVLARRALDTPYSGDERAYVDGAMAIANATRDLASFHPVDLAEIEANVVGNGWFLPGMSLLLAPVFLVAPAAGVVPVRIVLGVVTTLLLFVAVVVARRTMGTWAGVAVAVFPGLVPMWILFSYTAWGDLSAGLLLVLVLGAVVEIGRRLEAGHGIGPRAAVALGLLLAVLLYTRSSMVPHVAGLLVLVAGGALLPGSWRARGRAVGASVLAGLVVVVALAPWSVLATRALGAPVVTTSTLDISLGTIFGDREQMCFGPCPGRSPWFGSVQYSREVAAATGRSELEVQAEMSDHALRGLGAESYVDTVATNMAGYLFQPQGFVPRFRPPDAEGPDTTERLVRTTTRSMHFSALLLGLVGLLLVVRGPSRGRWTSLAVKVALVASLVQPFVHGAGSRYWPSFAPALALAAAMALCGITRCARRLRAGPAPAVGEPSAERTSVSEVWLVRAQAAVGIGLLVVTVGLAVVAA